MKCLKLAIGCIAFVTILIVTGYGQFYYARGQQHALRVDSLKICLKFESIIGQDDQENVIESIGRIISVLADEPSVDGFFVCTLSTNDEYSNFLDSVQEMDEIYLTEPYYLTVFDSSMLIGERFCVAFDSSTPISVIDSINSSFGIEVQYEFEGMPNVFVLLNKPASGYRTLELANLYYELPQARYAHPLFNPRIAQNSYKLYDYYNTYQPHTKKVIGSFNSASVWDFAGMNSPVVVAVIDDGNNAHEDLPSSRLLPGRNFVASVLAPEPSASQFHGMACAGIIAANHTTDSLFGLDSNSGVISLNPQVNVLPVKIFPVSAIDSAVNAINYAWMNGADVLSNSWNNPVATCASYPDDLLDNAITNAFTYGRGGKGTPVIFSAGNQTNLSSPVRYPACVPQAFAVGAVQLDDVRWTYSNYGTDLDLVAPSGDVGLQGDVWTVDQLGKDGANFPGGAFNCQPGHPIDGDYLCSFGGTSAAAPVVAGVAALILAKDSNLTAGEVYDILRYSAVTELESDTITPPDTAYGYGRVDAFRAILSISRGDLNNDGAIGNILDLNFLVDAMFRNGPLPFPSPLMGDCNCDGGANNTLDLNYLINRIFRFGPPPVNPCFEF